MPIDRRLDVPGGAYFFTLTLRDRRRRLLTELLISDAKDVDAPIASIHWNPFRYEGPEARSGDGSLLLPCTVL